MMNASKTFAVLFAAALLAVSTAGAQIPEKFTNLQVLPKDIARGDLIQKMRGMAGGLGVRCIHCHVGDDPNSLEGIDFASDERPAKEAARVMLRMVDEINGKLLPGIGKEAGELVEVRCRTCHHGQQRPQSLRDVLTEALEEDGVEAAVARYRELREKYYGRDTFDFGEWGLLNMAEGLAKSERVDDARALVELNVELNPEFGMNYVFLGQIHAKSGETARAIEYLTKGAELAPEMAPRIQPLIDKLKEEQEGR